MSSFSDFFPQGGGPIRGEMSFSVGVYDWVVPEGITEISCVCLGAGAGGWLDPANAKVSGGGGGSLAYVNGISVTAGETLNVYVGTGGKGGEYASSGGEVHIKRDTTVLIEAGGGIVGSSGVAGVGGTVIVGTGGSGGNGGYIDSSGAYGTAGGGGAGGYSGDGGVGATATTSNVDGGDAPAGGGGAGGGAGDNGGHSGNGGTVGLFGEGISGIGVPALTSDSNDCHGSGYLASYTTFSSTYHQQSTLPSSGGGSAVYSSTYFGAGEGGNGAIRIIWGEGRAFPSTDCGMS